MAGRLKCLAAVVLVLVLVLVLSVAWVSFVPVTPDAISWVAVRSQKLTHEMGLVGKIEPAETTVLTAPFDGHALANQLAPGMQVEQGQALLSLDTALLEIKVREALASQLRQQQAVEIYNVWSNGPQVMRAQQMLRRAELAMQSLDLEFSHVEALYQEGIVARNERDTLRQQRHLQSLELMAAKAELQDVKDAGKGKSKAIAHMELLNASAIHEQLSALLEHKTLYAPFAGVVLSLGGPATTEGENRALHEGALIAKGQPLISLANTAGLKVVTLVSESDVNKFSLNHPVLLSGDGFSGKPLNGYVSAISQLAVPDENPGSTARFAITVTLNPLLENALQGIRLGMSVHMTVVTYRNDHSFIIPHGAVEQSGDETFVMHRENHQAPVVRRKVTIGYSTAEGVEVFGVNSGFVAIQ